MTESFRNDGRVRYHYVTYVACMSNVLDVVFTVTFDFIWL